MRHDKLIMSAVLCERFGQATQSEEAARWSAKTQRRFVPLQRGQNALLSAFNQHGEVDEMHQHERHVPELKSNLINPFKLQLKMADQYDCLTMSQMPPALGTTKVTNAMIEMTIGIEMIQARSLLQATGLLITFIIVVTIKMMMSNTVLAAPPIPIPIPRTPNAAIQKLYN